MTICLNGIGQRSGSGPSCLPGPPVYSDRRVIKLWIHISRLLTDLADPEARRLARCGTEYLSIGHLENAPLVTTHSAPPPRARGVIDRPTYLAI